MEALIILVVFAILAFSSLWTERRDKRDPLAIAANQALHDLRRQVRKKATPQSLTRLNRDDVMTPPVGVPVLKVVANGKSKPR